MPEVMFPIVMARHQFCTGECKKITEHHVVIYPDNETTRCKVCNHHQVIRYDREAAVILKDIDQQELERLETQLNDLAGQLRRRKWGHLGKKDADFIERVAESLVALTKTVQRLKGQN